MRQERSKQDVSLLPENQQALKFIPCTGHSRIYLLQMKDVAFVSSRMSGVYVTSHEGKEGFTELTLRTRKVVHHYCAAIVSIWLTSRIYRRSVWKITAEPS